MAIRGPWLAALWDDPFLLFVQERGGLAFESGTTRRFRTKAEATAVGRTYTESGRRKLIVAVA